MWIEENTNEGREGRGMCAKAAMYIQIYGQSAKSRQSTRQGPRTEEREQIEEHTAHRRGRTERQSQRGRTEPEVKQETKQSRCERCYTLGPWREFGIVTPCSRCSNTGEGNWEHPWLCNSCRTGRRFNPAHCLGW